MFKKAFLKMSVYQDILYFHLTPQRIRLSKKE
jgi:hypothetical protein